MTRVFGENDIAQPVNINAILDLSEKESERFYLPVRHLNDIGEKFRWHVSFEGVQYTKYNILIQRHISIAVKSRS